MSDKALPRCTLRVRKLVVNRLLQRKQFVIQVTHEGRPSISRPELKELLAKMFKVADPQTIFTFGFKTAFGGGRSVGFGIIYDNLEAAKRLEPRFRLVRNDLAPKPEPSRKPQKEAKKKARKQWGTRVHQKKSESE